MNENGALLRHATAIEKSAESVASSRLGEIDVRIRDLWDPDTCPIELLPWLAWAFSVGGWKDYWGEKEKRDAIKLAVQIARKRGTRKSVDDVVKPFGANVAVREWWEREPVGQPHTFDVVVEFAGGEVTLQMQQDVAAEIKKVKPARSHFTLSVGLQAAGAVNVVGAVRVAAFSRMEFAG